MPLSLKDGKVTFRVSQETCQTSNNQFLPGFGEVIKLNNLYQYI